MEQSNKKGTNILGAAGSILGGISTIGGWLGIGEGRQDRRQVDQQRKLNAVNAQTSKELADYEQKLKMEMWKDTNYGAQLEQAKMAGVSKAAAIGGSGTGTQGASVSGISGTGAADAAATTNARTAQAQAGMQLASQVALMKAQKDNIEADTANKLAATPNINTNTGKQAAETANIEVQTLQNRLALEIGKGTQKDVENRIAAETSEAVNRAQSSLNTARVGTATVDAEINRIKAVGIGALIENQAKQQGIALDKARIQQITTELEQGWKQIENQGKSIDASLENMKELTKSMMISSGINAAGNIVNSIIDIKKMKMGKMMDKNNQTTTEMMDLYDADGNSRGSSVKRKY